MSGLHGRRVVVTRPRIRAAELCVALELRGAHVVEFPVIETQPVTADLDHALEGLARYDWIAFTSAAAVSVFVERLDLLGLREGLRARVAVVGPATAAAARLAGLLPDAMPHAHRGTELPAVMGPLSGRHVLLPASAIARDATAAALRAAGASVNVVTAYETRAVTPTGAALAELARGAAAVTFASPSAVAAFAEVGGPIAAGLLRTAVLACIGPTTGDSVRALGLPVMVEPLVHTAPALADALDRYFAAAVPPKELVQ